MTKDMNGKGLETKVEQAANESVESLKDDITAGRLAEEYPAETVAGLEKIIGTYSYDSYESEERKQFELDVEAFYQSLPSGSLESEMRLLEVETDEFISTLPQSLQADFISYLDGKHVYVDVKGSSASIAPEHAIELFEAVTKREFVRRAVPVLQAEYEAGNFYGKERNSKEMSDKFDQVLEDADVDFNLYHIDTEEFDQETDAD